MANTLKFGNGLWATKEGSTLAYNDENGNFKPLPFNFERAGSATRVNKEGLIEVVGNNEPRIDFKDNTKGALLLEPTRTNLLPYSNDFSNDAWSKNQSGTGLIPVVTPNSLISPDGTLNATKVVFNTGSGISSSDLSFLEDTVSTASGVAINQSVYLKGENGGETILIRGAAGGSYTTLTLTNEWVRYNATETSGSTSSTWAIGLRQGLGGVVINSTATIYMAFAQLEQGSYATSYIPTSGSIGTRVAESSSQTVPDGVKIENQGSLYFEFNSSYLETYTQRILTISEDANNIIEFQLAGSNLLTFVVVKSGQSEVIITKPFPAITLGENTKIAAAFSNGDFVFYVNGILIGTDTDASKSVPTISDIKFSRYNSTTPFVGSVNNLKLYNTRLSNSELQALTS